MAIADIAELVGAFGDLGDGSSAVASEFDAVSAHTKGDVLTVSDGVRGSVEGRFLGVDADGALRLATAAGDERVISGDVVTF